MRPWVVPGCRRNSRIWPLGSFVLWSIDLCCGRRYCIKECPHEEGVGHDGKAAGQGGGHTVCGKEHDMRTPESTIKAAILHPEEEVRMTALAYFSRCYSDDASIMPLVIEAVEKYGRDKAFRILREADDLAQSETTIQWLTGELGKDWDLEDVGNDNYCTAIALILCHARPDLLKAEFAELAGFPKELRGWFDERLAMASWDWDTAWAALQELGERVREQGHYCIRDNRRGTRIVESLARHREKGELILPLLHRRFKGYEKNLMEWLEPLLVELAGRMRLEAAVPILVERMMEDDFDLGDSCSFALQWIGGDVVVRAIAEGWSESEGEYRRSAAEVLEHVHSDSSAAKCLEFFAEEEEEDTRDFLVMALLGNFAEEAVEPIHEMLDVDDEDEVDVDPERIDLKYRLTAVCTISGLSFPDYEAWHKLAVEENWGWGWQERDRIRENFDDDDDEEEDEFDDEEMEDEDWEEYDSIDEEEDDFGSDVVEGFNQRLSGETIRRDGPKVGRNDPCPCGSGKKYKKCCLKKDQERDV